MKIYPKLNIFLNILPMNAERMHPIFSRFVLAKGKLYDEMEVSFGKERFEIQGDFDCVMQENLIYQTKEVFKKHFSQYAKEVESCCVEVQKKIPTGAGLGGGSANAGAFLRVLGEYFAIDHFTLLPLASEIGSDVSFFVSAFESANVKGVGEIVEEFSESAHYAYEIYTPNVKCETKKVYASFDENPKAIFKSDFLFSSSIELLYSYTREELNDLYLPALRVYPELARVAEELGEGWFFSGSGSSFFRIQR